MLNEWIPACMRPLAVPGNWLEPHLGKECNQEDLILQGTPNRSCLKPCCGHCYTPVGEIELAKRACARPLSPIHSLEFFSLPCFGASDVCEKVVCRWGSHVLWLLWPSPLNFVWYIFISLGNVTLLCVLLHAWILYISHCSFLNWRVFKI